MISLNRHEVTVTVFHRCVLMFKLRLQTERSKSVNELSESNLIGAIQNHRAQFTREERL